MPSSLARIPLSLVLLALLGACGAVHAQAPRDEAAVPGAEAQSAEEPSAEAPSAEASSTAQAAEAEPAETEPEAASEPASAPSSQQAPPQNRQAASANEELVPSNADEALALVASGVYDGTDVEMVPDMEPPDGEWLQDEEGREFFRRRLPKDENWYWIGDEQTHIRYRSYEVYEVERQDEESFYVRQYRRTEVPVRDRRGNTLEDLEAIAASYTQGSVEADRMEVLPFGEGLPDQGQWRNGFDVADMDGDGHPDIVHAPPRKLMFVPVIFLGDGAGNWRTWKAARFPSDIEYAYGDAKVADFDGDGHNDVALAMHVNGMRVLLGDGAGRFTDWSDGLDHWSAASNQVPGFSSRTLRVADWNGDGRPDLVTLGEGPRPKSGSGGAKIPDTGSFGVVVYLNQGDGSWTRLDATSGVRVFGDSLDLGDFDRDGRLDVATGSNTYGMRGIVHFGAEDGTLRTSLVEEVRPRNLVKAVTVADFDGDGRDDLAYAFSGNEDGTWRCGIDLLLSRGAGTWERRPLYLREERKPLFALASGDTDGDGSPEIVALDGEGRTLIFSRAGEAWGLEVSPEMARVDDGCRGYHAMLTDLDGDGTDELVEGFAGEPSALFAPAKCLSRGALRAWKLVEKPAG